MTLIWLFCWFGYLLVMMLFKGLNDEASLVYSTL